MSPVKLLLICFLFFLFLIFLYYPTLNNVMETDSQNSVGDILQKHFPMMAPELKIITLNVWGIPIVSRDISERMIAIANVLLKSNYDVVCLQEVWTNSDYNLISRRVKRKLPFSHYFYSGVFGSGICVLSKYPFQDLYFHQWPINGYIHKLMHGDWFGGKGVGMCQIMVNNYKINIYSAHLHAEYDQNFDEYKAHRVLQAFDTAQFIRLTGSSADLVVLAGDLNTEPGDLAYRILLSATGLTDAFTQAKNKESFMGTNEVYRNSYTSGNLIRKKFPGKRIDYIMYRSASKVSTVLQKYEHPLPARVPGKNYSYSDHEAVSASLQLSPITHPKSAKGDNSIYKSVLVESIKVCDEALISLSATKSFYFTLVFVSFCALVLFLGGPLHYYKTVDLLFIVIFITGCLFYALIMATLWNNIEYNAIFAGKLTMQVNLEHLLANEYSWFNFF